MTPSPAGAYDDPALEARAPYDPDAARRLLAAAGYPEGFEVRLNCPNNRYVNDEQICIALAGMWAQVKVRVKVVAEPRSTYFPRLEKYDFSMYMLGWGGASTDAEQVLTPVLRTRGRQRGRLLQLRPCDEREIRRASPRSEHRARPEQREAMIKAALREYKELHTTLPLHRQMIPWAARGNVDVVHRADNWLEVAWVTVRRGTGPVRPAGPTL